MGPLAPFAIPLGAHSQVSVWKGLLSPGLATTGALCDRRELGDLSDGRTTPTLGPAASGRLLGTTLL